MHNYQDNVQPSPDNNPCRNTLFFMYSSVKSLGAYVAQNAIEIKDSVQEILALSQQLSKHGCML